MFRLSFALAVAVLAFARVAAASSFDITWQAPASCGTKQDFESGVARVVGKSLEQLDSAWKSADVAIGEQDGGWHLRVRVTSASGAHRERHVSASTCREAVEAAELIVATSLSAAPTASDAEIGSVDADSASAEPRATNDTTVPVSAEPPRATPTQEAAPKTRARSATSATNPARSAPPHERAPLVWTVGARIGLEPWLLPSVTTFGAAVIGLESRRLRGELSLRASYPETHALDGGGGAQATLLTADLLGCYGEHAARFWIWGCLGGEAGAFFVQGELGPLLMNDRSKTEPWLAGLGQLTFGRELGAGLSLGLGATGVVAAQRIHVLEAGPQTSGNTELYSTAQADVRPFLELSGRFR